jgi:hypothetical protein
VVTSGGTFPNSWDLTLLVLSPNRTAIGNGGRAAQSDSLTGVPPGTGIYTIELAPQDQNVGTNIGNFSVDLTT